MHSSGPSGVTVLDGGMGRELLRIGAPFRQPEWSALALLDAPNTVVQAHTNFVNAGAHVITTNSYALVPFHIGEERFAAHGEGLADLAGRLARKAADAADERVLVAGSLPPLFGSYLPERFDHRDALRIIEPLVTGLDYHVDIWLGETLSSIAEAVAVGEAIAEFAKPRTVPRPIWISYTLEDAQSTTLRSGESVIDAVDAAVGLGASAVLFNCCQAESIGAAIAVAAGSAHRVAIGGYANRFVAAHRSDGEANEHLARLRDDLSPAGYREIVRTSIEHGATIVGGCCGMGPEHIAAIVALARS